MSSSILTTKLYVPPPRPSLVPRPHLLAQLDEALRAHHKLILVSAPAGFGKTTLLSEWISRRQGDQQTGRQREATSGPLVPSSPCPSVSFAWVSLDADDNDPVRFLTYLVTNLQTLHTPVGRPGSSLGGARGIGRARYAPPGARDGAAGV